MNDLPDDQRSDFLNQCAVKCFHENTPILRQGEKPNGMFIISHGTVEVSFVSETGHQTILFHAGSRHVLGVFEALATRNCAATCVAMPNTCVLFCPTPVLYNQLQSPVLIRNVATLACDMLRRDNASKAVDQQYTVEQRICNHLWQLSAHTTEIRQSQSYLATMVGCSRQTINKELGVLRDLEIIRASKGRITVLSRDALLKRIEDQSLKES